MQHQQQRRRRRGRRRGEEEEEEEVCYISAHASIFVDYSHLTSPSVSLDDNFEDEELVESVEPSLLCLRMLSVLLLKDGEFCDNARFSS